MFVGFGPFLRTLQCVLNIVGALIIAGVAAVLTAGKHLPNVIDFLALVLILLIALQNARLRRKGARFGDTEVVVSGHVFERVIRLANVTAVVIPRPPGVLKVIASDGGYASSQISANLLEMPVDRDARRAALDRLGAALEPRCVYVSEMPVPWASGLNRETPMVVKRTMAVTTEDIVWLASSFAVWLLLAVL